MCCLSVLLFVGLVGPGLLWRALRGASSSTQTSSGGLRGGSPEPVTEPA